MLKNLRVSFIPILGNTGPSQPCGAASKIAGVSKRVGRFDRPAGRTSRQAVRKRQKGQIRKLPIFLSRFAETVRIQSANIHRAAHKNLPAGESRPPGEKQKKKRCKPRKKACSGAFGTPGETRTHYIPLRRRTLYPGEVRGHFEKIFHFYSEKETNELPLGRWLRHPLHCQGTSRLFLRPCLSWWAASVHTAIFYPIFSWLSRKSGTFFTASYIYCPVVYFERRNIHAGKQYPPGGSG